MGFLLLGVDSVIACLAVGAIVSKRARVPFALCFGIADALGFLLGTALHWSMPGGVAMVVETAVFVALGVYWIALALLLRRSSGAKWTSETKWIWALPVALSIDNITFGLIDHSWTTNAWGQAGEQLLSSALLAGIGIAISVAVVNMIPRLRRWHERNSIGMLGFAGGALIVAAGVELLVG
jgi:hypothetical protein